MTYNNKFCASKNIKPRPIQNFSQRIRVFSRLGLPQTRATIYYDSSRAKTYIYYDSSIAKTYIYHDSRHNAKTSETRKEHIK